MAAHREVEILRRGTHEDGRLLTSTDREALLSRYLPRPRESERVLDQSRAATTWSGPSRQGSRYVSYTTQSGTAPLRRAYNVLQGFLGLMIYKLIFFWVQLVFSFYVRIRQAYHAIADRIFTILYYHHRTPELVRRDVKRLGRLPKHISVIVDNQNGHNGSETGLQSLFKLIDDVAEISAWCACAGIPTLSVYQRTGVLKSHIPLVQKSIMHNLQAYFPLSLIPHVKLRAPNLPNYSPPNSPSPPLTATSTALTIILLSATDGRDTLVDLTKTLAEMSQRGKLHPSDVTAELIDAEITESCCGEPDLLVVMAGSRSSTSTSRYKRAAGLSRTVSSNVVQGARETVCVDGFDTAKSIGAGDGICLQGYPPWQVRLTEIFYMPDNSGVEYQAFLRALHMYANAEMRFGR